MNIVSVLMKANIEKKNVDVKLINDSYFGLIQFDNELSSFYFQEVSYRLYINVEHILVVRVYN